MWLRIAFFINDWLIINDRLKRFFHFFFFRCLINQHLMLFRCLIIQHFNLFIRCFIQHLIDFRNRHFHDRDATAKINWNRILHFIAKINCCLILHILSELNQIIFKNHYFKMLLNIAYRFFSSDVYENLCMHIFIIFFFNKFNRRQKRHTNDENIFDICKFHFDDFVIISKLALNQHCFILLHFHSIIWDLYSTIRDEFNFFQKAIFIINQWIVVIRLSYFISLSSRLWLLRNVN